MTEQVLQHLYEVILSRKGADSSESYTAQLLEGGVSRVAQKVGEEATEVVVAAVDGEGDVVYESADLLYHLLVLWAAKDIAPEQVFAEVARRNGLSGLDEKANREE